MFKLYQKPVTSLNLNPKFYPNTYNEPVTKDMAIIMVLFNPCRSVRIAQNILLVKQYLDNANIPYYIGELSIDNSPFLFKECSHIFHYTTNDYMFYKENLINLVEARIPDTYTKICTMDGDIFYDNPNWYSLLTNALDEADICQPFRLANWLNIENNTIIKAQSTCVNNVNGHPGFAWAFKRSWYTLHKLPDFAVVGSGDAAFKDAVIDGCIPKDKNMMDMLSEYMKQVIERPVIRYIDVNIYHLYHGSLVNRKYVKRHAEIQTILSSFHMHSLSEVLDYDINGLRCWKEEFKHTMNAYMKSYLTNRNDDGV